MGAMGGSTVARLTMQHVPDAISQAMAVTKRPQRIALSSHRPPRGRRLIGTLARMAAPWSSVVTRREHGREHAPSGCSLTTTTAPAHPLKQRDPATSVAEPTRIPALLLAGPWTSRCAMAMHLPIMAPPSASTLDCLTPRIRPCSSAFFSTPPLFLCGPSMSLQSSHSLSRRAPWWQPAHLIPAPFNSPASTPSCLRVEGSRPEVPHPCAFDLALGAC